ncbi:MAG: metallophosphoesterase [Phycisphaeraceae bacterium]|nr:metallophosphoesterase [Phycisphaeraceae bacterium]MCW5764280.1 metallophosphoesterase [Phycisphaeraceae bacterium]
MRIAHVSDIHFGAADEDLIEAVIAAVRGIEPDLVVISGDLTMAARAREFRRAAAFIAALGAPVLSTPGNHDLPVFDLVERFTAPLRRYRRHIEPITMSALTTDKVAILSLNSARPWDLSWNWSHGRLSRAQIAEADAFFAAASAARFRALVVHHPFYVPEDLPGFRVIGNGEAMMAVLARRRVHAVLSGHLHQQAMVSREIELDEYVEQAGAGAGAGAHTVMLLQVASATTTRRRNQPNAFAVLEIGSGAGGAMDAGAVVRTEWVAEGDRFVAGEGEVVVRLDG